MTPENTPLAQLSDEQLKSLIEFEEELGVTLIAYESPMHDTNHIIESDV
ncbi:MULTISPECIES: hypothetical protein [Sporosarcina]|uniref:Uncharacterized protein n=1 Tax=Sporosarcina contaminans TaxID=633403 RepID=A0ABW3TZT6_9BACL